MIEIFYNVLPHPSVAQGDLYYKIQFGERKTMNMPIGVFKTYWRKMPEKEILTTEPLSYQFERLFGKYNSYKFNPLSNHNDPGQKKVKKSGAKHTSMMVGDIFKVKGKYYIVSSVGFKIVNMR